MLTLVRPAPRRSAVPALDTDQQAAVDHRGGLLRVLGAPGTGKTTVAVEVVAARVAAGELSADRCVLLAPTRHAAARLRDAVTARLGVTTAELLARTHASFAFGLLRQAAALAGDPSPRLLSGPEQDVVLRDLLAGHADASVAAPPWPERVAPALATRAFRQELRDLLMRAVECDLAPDDLAALGRANDRPEWVAAAHVLDEYDQVTALAEPAAFDPALILGRAAELVETDTDAAAWVSRRVGLVVVDDAQELTAPAVRLLQAVVAASGAPVVLLGDPDAATQTFRGADPRILTRGWLGLTPGAAADTGLGAGGQEQLLLPLGGPEPVTIRLGHSHRLSGGVHAAVARVAGHIGVLGEAQHRQTIPAPGDATVEVHLLRSAAQEAGFVAGLLREEHLVRGVPWSQMAVLVRGRARAGMLRRVLASSGVPVSASTDDLPVRDEMAARPLLSLLDVVTGGELGPDLLVELLSSPLGGADPVLVRRLRRGLRAGELEGGGGRSSDALIVDAMSTPSLLEGLGAEAVPARRLARALDAGHRAVADGADAEQVLWLMWQATGWAEPWREQALAGGLAGARADRDLDAVVALLDAAGRFVERLPQAPPRHFLDHVRSQDVPGDTLVSRSPSGERVDLLTPAAAAGRQWQVVAVAGVQEGSWPDLRVRGSLLGSSELVDVVRDGPGATRDHRAALAAVRHDETRLFLVAASRATERLVVTAVRSDDEQPSPYLDVVDPQPVGTDGAQPRGFTDDSRILTLPALVAHLRRLVVTGSPQERGAAVSGLARLVRAGVRGADPRGWWGLVGPSDERPMREPDEPVRVSPSRIEPFTQCGLRWLLTSAGGEGPSSGSAELGTLLHGIAHDLADASAAELDAELDRRWPWLGLTPGWTTDRRRAEAAAMVTKLSTYLTAAEAEGWRRVASEESIRVVLGRAVVAGTVDRVEADGQGRVRIADLKTGSSKPRSADVLQHPQLGVYQVAARCGAFAEHGRESAGALLVQIGKAGGAKASSIMQTQPALDDADDPQWAETMLAEVADGMAAATVLARPMTGNCRTCPVTACCPARAEGALT